MKLWPALLSLLLAACGPPPAETLRLVTLEDSPTSGLALRELPAATLQGLGLRYGLAVVRAEGSAERAGLRIGDVVYGVERTRVRSFEEFVRLLGSRPEGKVGLMVRRGKADFYVAMPLGSPRAPGAPPPAKDTLLST